ncbi:MAG: hypothetical protein ABSD70_18885 [Terracidiphilus sp.]|jgi:beta-fructofuranosidase
MNRRQFVGGAISVAAAGGLFRTIDAEEAPSSLAAKLADDPLRPQYHLLPPANWTNDPNGPIY